MRYVLIFLYVVLICSCSGSPKKTNQQISELDHTDEIKKYLAYQNRIESEEKEFDNPHKLSAKDLFLALNLEKKSLKKNGFKTLDKSEFEEKIFKIFGIKANSNNCNKVKITDSLITYFGSNLDGTIETLNQNEFELQSITNNLFFSRSGSFFTEMYLLKELVIFKDDNYKISIPQKVIARNKYLLNDDKSLFTWLTMNDVFFMKSLVTQFGYTRDKELLRWIIRNYSFEQSSKDITNGIEFGHILYSRNCQNKFFKIHKEIFDIMEAEMNPANAIYLDNLLEYAKYLSDIHNDSTLTFSERSSIVAHILYFGQKLANNKGYDSFKFKCMGFFHKHLDTNNKFEEEFKSNNYYGLLNYKEMWNNAIVEGDGIAMPGEE